MISDIFFNNSIDYNNQEIFTESYVHYYLVSIMFDNEGCELSFLIDKLQEKYGNFNFSKANKFISKHFAEYKGYYLLNNKQEEAYLKTKKFKQDLFFLEWESDKEIFKKLSDYITQKLINFSSGLPYAITLYKKRSGINQDLCASIYFDYIYNHSKYDLQVDKVVNLIDDSYDKLTLNIIISNSSILEILFANEINTIKDLKSLSTDSLMVLFSIDYENIVKSLEPLNDNFDLSYKDKINSIFARLKDRELEIIVHRNGLSGQKPMTLEEVGMMYDVTRERCRQIEAKAITKLKNSSIEVKNLLVNLFLKLCTQEVRYISEEKIFEFVGDNRLSRYILFLYEISSFDIRYSHDLKVVYNKNLTSLEDICNEVIDVYDDVMTMTEYDCLNSFEKSVINYSYRVFKDTLYVKKGIGSKELVCMTIDDLFPEGYRIGSSEDYTKLEEAFTNKYGISDEFPSDRSIVGFLERSNYCQIDKGTYKNRSYCITLPQDLIEEIINFILMNQPTVFYSTIYEKYKNRLNELGIGNYYYLKGLIDAYLPDDFVTKRNYITVGNEKLSSYESILNYMKSFNGVFTLNDLKMKFVGVKDYTFLNAFYNECENNLIALGNQKYIYIDKVIITENTVAEFKQFVNDTFKFMGTKVISSRKIYARMSLLNKDLLSRLKIATDSFSTFSLIYHYFKNDYGFHRPLLSMNKNDIVNSYVLITNYVSTLDSFNAKTIKNYTSKMNIGGLYSYLQFMEEQSDNFVQVNIDTMVAKEKLAISDSNLKEIEKMLDLIFNRFDEIDTRRFNGYAMLPKLTYLWSKYLLVGIIRSFFNDIYEVENTETTYDSTDFIIRRIK